MIHSLAISNTENKHVCIIITYIHIYIYIYALVAGIKDTALDPRELKSKVASYSRSPRWKIGL